MLTFFIALIVCPKGTKQTVAKHPFIVFFAHYNQLINAPSLCHQTIKTKDMPTLAFDIAIAASAKKTWQVLWFDSTYRQWTSAFMEGSYAVSDWQQGSKVQFLAPGGNGMYSIIAECLPEERMVFAHQGEVKNHEELPPAEWSGSKEGYALTEKDGITTVAVSLDTSESYAAYFSQAFPKALALLKALAEKPVALTVSAAIAATPEKVWQLWTEPQHIMQWNSASPDWHTPKAENDLRIGGKFSSRMEAKDGSMGFDFEGTYTAVEPLARIAYTMGDGRSADIAFASEGDSCRVTIVFDAEETNPYAMQQGGWQAILDNFKKYTEGVES
jgi:uncharacterized protein YndB with AHSA1/START domain